MGSGEVNAGQLRPSPQVPGRPWARALSWPLWQVGLVMAIFSLPSFAADLAQGQVDGSWSSLSFQVQSSGLLGTWTALGQGPVGRYFFYTTLATLLLTIGALVAAFGGLLCWWRFRPARGVLAIGLLMAVMGQLAGVPQAMSQAQVFHQGLAPLVAEAILGATWIGALLALVLLASRGGPSPGPQSSSRAVSALPSLGVIFFVFGALQLLAAAFGAPSDLSANKPVSQMPDIQVGMAYAVLSLAAPAVIMVAGSNMWRGAEWAPRLAVWGWFGVVAQGLILFVGGWVALGSTGLAPAAVAPGASTSAFALLALWILRAVRLQIWRPGGASGPSDPAPKPGSAAA